MRKSLLASALYVSSAVTAICFGPVAAHAAPPSEDNSVAQIQEVVVTARRVQEAAQDVPISMTVFNQQELTNHVIVNSEDLVKYTPSLSSVDFTGPTSTTFSIRGFTQDIGTDPTVGVYFNDVPALRAYSNEQTPGNGAGPGAFFDLQNVQVLKGPQGTLFGRNTTGGAVLLVPQAPTDHFGGFIQATAGDYNTKGIQGVLNVPVNDKIRLRFGVDHFDRDGYLKNNTGVGPSDLNDTHYTSVRASAAFDITSNLENTLVGTFSNIDEHGNILKLVGANNLPLTLNNLVANPGATLIGNLAGGQIATFQPAYAACGANCQPNSVPASQYFAVQGSLPNPSTRVKQWQIINTTTWYAHENVTVKNIFSYGQYTQDLDTNVFGTYFDLSRLNAPLSPLTVPTVSLLGGIPVPPGTFVSLVDSNANPPGHTADQGDLTEEFRLSGKSFGGALDWQSGVYAEFSDPLSLVGSSSPTSAICEGFDCAAPAGPSFSGLGYTTSKTTYRTFGIYGQGSYRITNQLTLTGGLRYTKDHQRVDGFLINYRYIPSLSLQPPLPVGAGSICTNVDAKPPTCEQSISESSSAPTWLIDLEYKPLQDVLAYAKYTRGYRTGGVTLQAPTALQTFKPEKLDSYEVGAKTTFAGAVPGLFNISVFYNDFSNQQIFINLNPAPGFSPATAISNAGQSRIYGLEAEFAVVPFKGFTLSGGYTYLNSRINKIAIPRLAANIPYTITGAPQVGDPLLFTPPNKVTLTASYVLPLDPSVGKVTMSATYNYTDVQPANEATREPASGSGPCDGTVDAATGNLVNTGKLCGMALLGVRNVLDLNLNWDHVAQSPVSLSFFATNVTNDRYYYITSNAFYTNGYNMAGIGAPRMFGVRLRYDFGEQ
jgi:iron complex outermembrane receptor protein